MEQVLSDVARKPVSVLFSPHLIPMDRGIFSTIYATPTAGVTEPELIDLYRGYYAGKPFVRVRAGFPATKDTSGTNFLDVAPKVVRGKVVATRTGRRTSASSARRRGPNTPGGKNSSPSGWRSVLDTRMGAIGRGTTSRRRAGSRNPRGRCSWRGRRSPTRTRSARWR
jgi:N-acetyl-gamma-glutamyl-phosphate reductase